MYYGAQWLSGRVGSSLTIVTVLCPCSILVQPRKTCPDITENLEHIQWRAIANRSPHSRRNLMVIEPLTPSQGHKFDCRVNFFSESWATGHHPL